MKTAVVVFPASNCDRDAATALESITGTKPAMLWHGDAHVPDGLDLIVLPGGFSYGDYLRCGAMASQSPIMREVAQAAARGVPVAGICNGFQILTETGLLPGVLMRNSGLKFVCRPVTLSVANHETLFTRFYGAGEEISIPVAHGEGNYFADAETLDRLEGEGRVVFRYKDNPNGSARDIAGIVNEGGNVIGLMPHPERHCDPLLGSTDGRRFFESVLGGRA
jgi:phosphoribosylformylglycinamidine synthase subunit PurQ / glutaminase